MKKSLFVGISGLGMAAAMIALGLAAGNAALPPASPARSTAQDGATATDRQEIQAIVREYLIAHPEVMLEVQASLERKHQQQQRQMQSAVIDNHAEGLFLAGTDGVLGNPEGNVTIVEFFDYNCGYCKRALGDMQAMIEADPELRFVLKEFPILGADSQRAHVVSMALQSLHPELYQEFHIRLLASSERVDEEAAMALALELGANEAALREAMAKPEINEALALNYELANLLSITGTPSYVVGDEVVFGALGEETLSAKVANFRECQSTEC